jgi:hypothetical protein
LALGDQKIGKSIITTHTDFQRLCKRLKLEYLNPIPDDLLKRFKA